MIEVGKYKLQYFLIHAPFMIQWLRNMSGSVCHELTASGVKGQHLKKLFQEIIIGKVNASQICMKRGAHRRGYSACGSIRARLSSTGIITIAVLLYCNAVHLTIQAVES